MGSMRRSRRWIVVAPLVTVLLIPACKAAQEETSAESEPMTVEPIEGTDFSRVILTADGAERVGLETTEVAAEEGETIVPAAAVWIDVNGDEWVYTEPDPLVFVRAAISVDRYDGDVAVLSDGPSVGTDVVSVGVAELIGSEFGI
jgi:hypothetical protein